MIFSLVLTSVLCFLFAKNMFDVFLFSLLSYFIFILLFSFGRWYQVRLAKKCAEAISDFPDGKLALLSLKLRYVKNLYIEQGIDLSDINAAVSAQPSIIRSLDKSSRMFYLSGDLVMATATAVWLHTARGVLNKNIEPFALKIWRKIEGDEICPYNNTSNKR